jgi:hypothetical protein
MPTSASGYNVPYEWQINKFTNNSFFEPLGALILLRHPGCAAGNLRLGIHLPCFVALAISNDTR